MDGTNWQATQPSSKARNVAFNIGAGLQEEQERRVSYGNSFVNSALRNQHFLRTFSHRSPASGARGETMKPLVWLGIALVVAWAVLWLGVKMAVFAVHALLLIGVALIVWGLLHRGHADSPS
jgi:Flp pilus assembly protein TadB